MRIRNLLYRLMVHYGYLFTDKYYIKRQFFHNLHYFPNLLEPKTFQEKLQWLKLYGNKPIYTRMSDKYEVKSFISEKIGPQYVIPTIGVYDKPEDIVYEKITPPFVIKTTHDSGTVIICENTQKLDIKKTNKYLRKRLKKKYYLKERELNYKYVKPRVIIEKMIGNSNEDLKDYKFYCFNGEPKLMFIVSNRWGEGGHKADYYDMSGNFVPINTPGFENSINTKLLLPESVFQEMKRLASILSEGIPHIRVDFYYTGDRIYVGELTFFDAGGYLPFFPEKYNKILGDWIKLDVSCKNTRLE